MEPKAAAAGSRITVLTGATGFLGREILTALLQHDPEERVLVPIRASRGRSAEERLAALLEQMYPDETRREGAARRVDALETDLSRDDPNLQKTLIEQIAGRRCRLIHGAATVSFDLPLEEARRINVEGTRRVLDVAIALAEAGVFERFGYIGTAYVAGDRTGRVLEDELDVGQGFTNTYERTKLEAEELVRSYRNRLPCSIFRPSIVAGHSVTGSTSSFKVLYWPLKVFVRGLVLVIPGDPDSCHDIVPVDFVAESLLHILERSDSVGGCYHLTAGGMVTLDEAVQLAAECFDVRRIPPYVSPHRVYALLRPLFYLTLFGRWRRVMKMGDVYIPYLSKKLVFDNRNTRAALEGSGLRVPNVETYLKTIFRFAKESDWGKRVS